MALEVGNLVVRLGVDMDELSSGMSAARTEVTNTAKAAEEAAKRTEKAATEAGSAGKKIGTDVAEGARKATTSLESTGAAAQKLGTELAETGEDGKKVGTGTATGATQANKSIESTGIAATRLRAQFAQNSAAGRDMGTATEAGARRATTAVKSTSDAAGQLRARFAEASATGRSVNVSTQPRTELVAASGSARDFSAALGQAKGFAAMLGVAFGAQQAVGFFTNAITDARALGAQTNQLNVLYGESKAGMEEWGQSALENLKMSQREAQGAAIQFATFGQMAGKSGEGLATFSQDMTLLAAESASFFGIPAEEMISAMGSAFAGESEPMKKFGVVLTDTELRAAAFAAGITDSNRELTAQEKVLATQAALMDKLGHTYGDMDRSQGKLGQNIKILKAGFEETSAAIGTKLTPIANAFVQLLSGPGLEALSGFGDGLGLVVDGITTLASIFGNLPGPIQAALGAIVAMRIGQRLLGDQVSALGTTLGGTRAAWGTYTAGVRDAYTSARTTSPELGRLNAAMVTLGRSGSGSISAVGRGFTSAAGATTGFTGALRGVAGASIAAGRGMASGLMGALGGPWGVALTVATLALGAFMGHVQKSKGDQEAAAAATRDWSAAFEESGGAIDENISAMMRKKVADLEGAGTLDAYGYSIADVTAALMTQGGAFDEIIAKMEGAQDGAMTGSLVADLANGSGETVASTQAVIDGLTQLRDEYNQGREMAATLTEAQNAQAASMRDQGREAEIVTPAMQAVHDAMAEMSDTAATGADKVKSLSDALDALHGDQMTVEEATHSVNEAIRDLDFSEVEAGMIGANGAIDTTTKAGADLWDQVNDLTEGTHGLAAAQLEMALRNGQTLPEALGAATLAVEDQRQALIDAAMAAGIGEDAAKKLADHYGLIPETVRTTLEQSGAAEARDVIAAIGDQLVTVTGDHSFRVDALTDEAKLRLMEIGYGVQEIDGEFEITANNANALASLAAARAEVDGFPKDANVEVTAATEQLVVALNDVGVQVRALPPGQVRLLDNTPEVRAKLEELKVGYTEIDGHIAITDNTPEKVDALLGVSEHVRMLPPGHIEITDTSPENIAKLNELGIKTTTLPNGKVVITDNALDTANNIDEKLNGKTTSGRHNIITSIIDNVRSLWGSNADGGYYPSVETFADGGTYGKPMAASQLPAKATPPAVESHQAQIAPAGAWRVWAEEETGGEAYIPLGASKRKRSTSILAAVASAFGFTLASAGAPTAGMADIAASGILPGVGVQAFADGGFSTGRSLTGTPYIFGGFSPAGVDCSGMGAVLANEGTGRDPYSERMSTATASSFLAARGGRPGRGKHGDLRFGWFNGGPGGGHMAITLPDGTPAESSSGVGARVGGSAIGHDDPMFTDHGYIPADLLVSGARVAGSGGGKADNRSARERTIDAIVQEGLDRGLSDEDIITALMVSEQESGTRVLANPNDPESMAFDHEGTGTDHDSSGPFQQRNNGAWGTAADRMDPRRSSAMFYDELEKIEGREAMRKTEVAQKVQRSAYPEAYAKHEGKAAEMLAASKSRISSIGGGSTSAGGDGEGQRVYVTNWPGGSFSGASGGSSSGGSGGGGASQGGGEIVREGSLAAMLMAHAGVTETDLFGEAAEGKATGKEKRFDDTKILEKEGDIEVAREQARIARIKLEELKNKTDSKGKPTPPSESALASAELRASEAERKVTKLEHDLRELERQSAEVRAHNESIGVDVTNYADGGFHGVRGGFGGLENHTAHIAPAGSYRVFGEDETGGEAYIPLASSKKARSTDIWLETGKRLGLIGGGVLGAGISAIGALTQGSLSNNTSGDFGFDDIGIDPSAVVDRLSPHVDAQAAEFGQAVAEAAAQFLGRVNQDVGAAVSAAANTQAHAGQLAREQIARAML